jgi:hypothetical protein
MARKEIISGTAHWRGSSSWSLACTRALLPAPPPGWIAARLTRARSPRAITAPSTLGGQWHVADWAYPAARCWPSPARVRPHLLGRYVTKPGPRTTGSEHSPSGSYPSPTAERALARPEKEGHVRRRLIGAAAALALSVSPVILTATPATATAAPAATIIHVCTASGNNYCLGATSITDGTPITNSNPGRDIFPSPQFFEQGFGEVYRLEFSADTTKCVGFSANGLAEVRDCLGNSNFTNWVDGNFGDGTTTWTNWTYVPDNCQRQGDRGADLTSNNQLGSRIYCSGTNTPGDYIRFKPALSP